MILKLLYLSQSSLTSIFLFAHTNPHITRYLLSKFEKNRYGGRVLYQGLEKGEENISLLAFASKLGGPLQMFMGEIIEYSST